MAALIVALAAMTLPALRGLLGSNRLVTAGNSVAGLVGFARQQAISKGTMTALLLLANQGTDADYRAFTVLEFNHERGWTQATKWQTLPTGVLVDFQDPQQCTFMANSPVPFPFLDGPPVQANPPVRYQNVPIKSSGGYAARIFMPSGSLQNPESPAQIRLVEGVLQGNGIVRTGSANYYEVAIIGATGGLKIRRP